MHEWAQSYGLWGLFVSAFVSATLAPGGSEAVLAYLARYGQASATDLLGVATAGNSLGALTTLGLGWLLARRHGAEQVLSPGRHKSVEHVKRWGIPLLLLSWLPLFGDGFCFAAGWLRLPFWRSVMAIALGKAVRYAAIIAAVT